MSPGRPGGVGDAAEPAAAGGGEPSAAAPEPSVAGEAAPPRRGTVSFQDENTVAREPTLAEKRAREQAARRAEAAEAARWDEMARQAARRRKLLVAGCVVAGVAAVAAIGYALSRPDRTEARCVGSDGVVVDDRNCVTPASSPGYHTGGGFFPIFIGGGGRRYHYTYGGSGDLGQVATGGTTVPPRTGTVSTPSGRDLDPTGAAGSSRSDRSDRAGSSGIRRGGFGVGRSHRVGRR